MLDICGPPQLDHFSQLIHLVGAVVVVVLHGRRIMELPPLRRNKSVEEEEQTCEDCQHVVLRTDRRKSKRDTAKRS